MKKDDMPLCNEMKECFARTMGGECSILISTYPPGKCPFRKPFDTPVSDDIRQILDKNIVLTAMHNVEKQCTYYLGKGEKFCKCTTNRKCKGCKFYSPNLAVRMKMMAESVIDLERSRNGLRRDLRIMEEKYSKEKEKAMVMLWQDSINSYE